MRYTTLICGVALTLLVGCSSTKQFAQRVNPLKPTDHALQFDLARASESDGHLAKAEATYRGLCDAKPKEAKYHQRLGVVLIRLGRHEEGLQELNVANQLEPSNIHILNDVGYGYLRSGDAETAIETLTKAREIDPQNKQTTNNLALAYGYRGDLRESLKIFQQSLSESEAMANLGYLATQSGNTELAIKAYSRSLSLDPEMRSAAEALAQLATIHQDVEHTRSIAADLETEKPKSPGVTNMKKTRLIEGVTLAETGTPSTKSSKLLANRAFEADDAE